MPIGYSRKRRSLKLDLVVCPMIQWGKISRYSDYSICTPTVQICTKLSTCLPPNPGGVNRPLGMFLIERNSSMNCYVTESFVGITAIPANGNHDTSLHSIHFVSSSTLFEQAEVDLTMFSLSKGLCDEDESTKMVASSTAIAPKAAL